MGSGFVLHPGIVNILIAVILKCESEDFGSGGGGEGKKVERHFFLKRTKTPKELVLNVFFGGRGI